MVLVGGGPELAPRRPGSTDVDGEPGKEALHLAAALWPPSWASAADNDDEDGEEVLVPRTPPPASKTFDAAAAVVKVGGKQEECVAGEGGEW